jgi:hypothetical protein
MKKTKKKLAQFLIFYYLMHACIYMSKHVYANVYIILILLRTSEIIFSIYTLSIFIVGNISISDSICVRHSTFVLFYYFIIGKKPTLESLINLLN